MIENQNNTIEKQESKSSDAKNAQELSSNLWNELKEATKLLPSILKDATQGAVCKPESIDLNPASLYKSESHSIKKHTGNIEKPITPNPLDGRSVLQKSTENSAPQVETPRDVNKPAEAKDSKDSKDSKDAKDKKDQPYGENNPFVGAEIKKDVEPTTHVVTPSDNLTKIARKHLGPDATPQEVQQHIDEIAKLNKIKNPNLILDGQVLKIPGHTADGGTVTKTESGDTVTAWKDKTVRVDRQDNTGYVKTADGTEVHWGPKNKDNFSVSITDDGGRAVKDYNGNTTTSWDDGVVRKENADGTGSVRRPAEGGGYTEHNWGPKTEDNYDVVKTSDGKYKIADGEGDKVGHEPKDANEKLQAEKARLNDRLQERLGNDPEALDRAKADMKAFEKRAAEQKPPMSPEEVAKTYDQVSKILESKTDVPVSQTDKAKIAEQVLHQSAHPNEVRQGYHNTCNVTTIESRMYTKYPSEAARVVAEASITGQVTMSDGRVVQVPAGSLQPDAQASHHPSPDNERSHASQIFQVAAVNDYYDRQNNSTTPPGQVRYEQDVPTGPNDTGERLWNYGTTPRTPATDAAGTALSPPDIPTSELEKISNNITGKNEKDFVIINGKYGDKNTVKVNSEKELGEKLEQMKKDGKLPAIIWVDAKNEPFFTDSGAGSNGGSGGAHVVTITDYDPDTKQAKIDNQWDQADDHPVSIHDLYTATRPASDQSTIDRYETDVAWDRLFGTEDGFKEMELLRLQRNANKLTDAEYDQKMIDTMREQEKRWKEDGETYPGEAQRARAKYQQMLGFLPAARAQAIKTAVEAS
ncbi:MAG: LysM peptidoglycan-binding domain-containing protein [Candidatus Obscuribacterales bacterium]|jgi:hypothetical protein|nr:LysM peptidoglycan-binding domain-containing protein [Candidatus Obscuribacterales bacterium]